MVDRNQQARDRFALQQEAARIRRQFVADVTAGHVQVIDRIAQPITIGALVIYRPPHDFVYEVADIKPVLDPRAQPGLVELTLRCQVPVTFMANVPIMGMIRVGTQQAPGHASLDPITPPEGAAEGSLTDDEPAQEPGAVHPPNPITGDD